MMSQAPLIACAASAPLAIHRSTRIRALGKPVVTQISLGEVLKSQGFAVDPILAAVELWSSFRAYVTARGHGCTLCNPLPRVVRGTTVTGVPSGTSRLNCPKCRFFSKNCGCVHPQHINLHSPYNSATADSPIWPST